MKSILLTVAVMLVASIIAANVAGNQGMKSGERAGRAHALVFPTCYLCEKNDAWVAEHPKETKEAAKQMDAKCSACKRNSNRLNADNAALNTEVPWDSQPKLGCRFCLDALVRGWNALMRSEESERPAW